MNKITATATQPVQIGWRRGDSLDGLLTREWLVTNALGGYASGTVAAHAHAVFMDI